MRVIRTVFYNNQAKAGMKRKASETQEAMHSIMTSSIMSEEYAVNLPKLDTFNSNSLASRWYL